MQEKWDKMTKWGQRPFFTFNFKSTPLASFLIPAAL
jgi:hypothetical protein